MQFYKKNPILRFLGQTAGVKINKLEWTLGLNANSTEFKKVSGSDWPNPDCTCFYVFFGFSQVWLGPAGGRCRRRPACAGSLASPCRTSACF